MIIFLTFCLFVWLYIRFSRRYEKSVAFFHPYCDAGGGGEKVLWEAVNAVRQTFPSYQIFVYTGDDASSSDILFRAESRFNLKISDVKLVKLKWRWLVEVTVSNFSFSKFWQFYETHIKLKHGLILPLLANLLDRFSWHLKQ